MRISELAERSGVSIATVKYYLREGLLPPGQRLNRTQADYGEEHLKRLAVIRALIESAGLSVARAKLVLAAVDSPQSMLDLLAAITEADAGVQSGDHAEARALVAELGWDQVPTDSGAMVRLQAGLDALAGSGLELPDRHLVRVAELMGTIAELEVAGIPDGDASAAAEYVLLGTALVAPILLALREVGHIHYASQRFGTPDVTGG